MNTSAIGVWRKQPHEDIIVINGSSYPKHFNVLRVLGSAYDLVLGIAVDRLRFTAS